MREPPFRLADHVRACFSPRGTILLDLKRDIYVGLDATQTRALGGLVESWPGPNVSVGAAQPKASTAASVSAAVALEFATSLCGRGLLARAARRESAPASVSLQRAEAQLIPWDEMTAAHVSVVTILQFVKSMLTVAAVLKLGSFHSLLARAARRKCRVKPHRRVPDLAHARALVGAFCYIRAFFYGKKNRCLFDSATLIEFLAHHRIYPDWVIAVQVQPFAAHSWVQHETWVLNGPPELVRAYEPIVVI